MITLTIYWNTGTWDGPRSLHEMLETQEPEILNYISDYKLNLIVPDELMDFDKFRTELGFLLEFFQHADNADALEQFINNKQTDETALSIDAIHLLNTCLNAGIELSDQKEDVPVCKGIDELVARGERRGEAKGEAKGKQTTLIELVRDGLLDITEAARRIEMDVEEFKLLLNNPADLH